jgi:glycosyltransferase involved in cell wall biosynthesis
MPAVSVVIPTYNRADVLQRAINSVLNQTFTDFELIIVDDYSADNTEKVVDKYDDERISYIRFNENCGANAARNTGIKASNGDYVSFLDSDDEFHVKHLESVVSDLKDIDTSCAGAFTAFKHVHDGSVVTISGAPDGLITQEQLIATNVVGGFSTVTLRSEVFKEVGPLDEEMPSAQDIEYFIRVLEQYSMLGIDRPLVTYYRDGERISDDLDSRIAGQRRLIEKHGDKLSRAGYSRIFSSRAFAHARNGNLTAARQNFGRAIKSDPTNALAYYHYIGALFGPRLFQGALSLKQWLKVHLYKLFSDR